MNKSIKKLKVDGKWRGKTIKAVRRLSNGWYVIKTENSKSPKDFKVKTIFSLKPQKSMTPKHAHFVIDFYGKLCANKEKAKLVFNAIVEVWRGKNVKSILITEFLKVEKKKLLSRINIMSLITQKEVL